MSIFKKQQHNANGKFVAPKHMANADFQWKITRSPSDNALRTLPPEQNKKKSRLGAIVPIILSLLGLVIMFYPVFATLVMNHVQQELTQETRANALKKLGPDKIAKMIKDAEKYNLSLHSGPILDPFLKEVAPDTPIYHRYLRYLNFGDEIMGNVKIPKIKVDLPIYHGTYDDALSRGVGHLFGSSLPVGGKDTHTVLTAHSGLANATMFDRLPELKKGDVFYIDVIGKVLKYQVYKKEVVLPTQTQSLLIHPGQDEATLVTCTPYGINTHRLLVHAKRVPMDKKEAKQIEDESYSIWQTWMWIPVVFALVVLFLIFGHYLFGIGRRKKKKDDDNPKKPLNGGAPQGDTPQGGTDAVGLAALAHSAANASSSAGASLDTPLSPPSFPTSDNADVSGDMPPVVPPQSKATSLNDDAEFSALFEGTENERRSSKDSQSLSDELSALSDN